MVVAKKRVRVMELFAGVGGFRIGLEGSNTPPGRRKYEVVWSSQFEPGTRRQHASEIYVARWGAEGHSNENIFSVVDDADKFEEVVRAAPQMLVGGFPCQDYSVAATSAKGLEGKKGVLWWALHKSLVRLAERGQPVQYLTLENVDRLLNSPKSPRGRDFAVILASLAQLGYALEWRVVNAADYGHAQARKRVFLVGYHRSTVLYREAQAQLQGHDATGWLLRDGVLAESFPAVAAASSKKISLPLGSIVLGCDPIEVQQRYTANAGGTTRFQNAGVMLDGQVWTRKVAVAPLDDFSPFTGQRDPLTLGDIVGATHDVPAEYCIGEEQLERWRYLKGAKHLPRVSSTGHAYAYSEGAMRFPDALSRPSRTIITSEGQSAPSRTTHVVADRSGRLRRLVPSELEALNGFPAGFTALPGVPDTKRGFMMGNALVVGLVRRIGDVLWERMG